MFTNIQSSCLHCGLHWVIISARHVRLPIDTPSMSAESRTCFYSTLTSTDSRRLEIELKALRIPFKIPSFADKNFYLQLKAFSFNSFFHFSIFNFLNAAERKLLTGALSSNTIQKKNACFPPPSHLNRDRRNYSKSMLSSLIHSLNLWCKRRFHQGTFASLSSKQHTYEPICFISQETYRKNL